MIFVRRLPALVMGSELDVERPRRAVLVSDVEDLVGDRRRLAKEIVGLVGVQARPRPRRVDGGVDGHVGDVNALRPQIAATSGFLLMFPKSEIVYLDMTFEEASKFIVSAGTSDSKSK